MEGVKICESRQRCSSGEDAQCCCIQSGWVANVDMDGLLWEVADMRDCRLYGICDYKITSMPVWTTEMLHEFWELQNSRAVIDELNGLIGYRRVPDNLIDPIIHGLGYLHQGCMRCWCTVSVLPTVDGCCACYSSPANRKLKHLYRSTPKLLNNNNHDFTSQKLVHWCLDLFISLCRWCFNTLVWISVDRGTRRPETPMLSEVKLVFFSGHLSNASLRKGHHVNILNMLLCPLLSFCKLGPCWLTSTIGKTLTMDEPPSNNPNYHFWEQF